jgi:hypothetical protein
LRFAICEHLLGKSHELSYLAIVLPFAIWDEARMREGLRDSVRLRVALFLTAIRSAVGNKEKLQMTFSVELAIHIAELLQSSDRFVCRKAVKCFQAVISNSRAIRRF